MTKQSDIERARKARARAEKQRLANENRPTFGVVKGNRTFGGDRSRKTAPGSDKDPEPA